MKQNIFYRFDSKDNLNETIEAKRRVKTQVPASSNDSLEVKLLYKEAQIKARISQFSSDKHQLKKRLSVLKRNLVQLHSRYQEKMFENTWVEDHRSRSPEQLKSHSQELRCAQRTSCNKSLNKLNQMRQYQQDQNQKLTRVNFLQDQKQAYQVDLSKTRGLIVQTEDQIKLIKQKIAYLRGMLVDTLYNLMDSTRYPLLDGITKLSLMNVQLDPKRLPSFLNTLDREYLIDKVIFQLSNQSTQLLDQIFIKKLAERVSGQPYESTLEYLNKLFGQEAYQYLDRLRIKQARPKAKSLHK